MCVNTHVGNYLRWDLYQTERRMNKSVTQPFSVAFCPSATQARGQTRGEEVVSTPPGRNAGVRKKTGGFISTLHLQPLMTMVGSMGKGYR